MNQDGFAGANSCTMIESVVSCEESNWNPGSLFRTEVSWLASDEITRNRDARSKRAGRDCNDYVAYSPMQDRVADTRNAAATFGTQGHWAIRQARVQLESFHHVAEIEPGCQDFYFDFISR